MIQCNLTEYQLEIYNDAPKFHVLLKHKIYCVGRVDGELNSAHHMHLKNIEIFEKAIYAKCNMLGQALRKFLIISTPSYRGRGLVSVLLIGLVEFAYEKRVSCIWVSVKSSGGLA